MKSALRASLFLFVFILSLNSAKAQSWQSYEAADYNVKFSVPADWKTTTGMEGEVPYLESTSQDGLISVYVYIYKDGSIGTRDLLNEAINSLGVKLNSDINEEELNGMHAYVAGASGMIDGVEMAMYIVAATYAENNYVAYLFTGAAFFEQNSEVMNKIIDSIEPMRK